MAIHAQMNTNQVGSEFALINNNGVIGIRNDQSLMNQNNNLQMQKDLYQQALFHHQQKQKQEIYELIRIQNERLRYVVQAQMRQENEMILKKMEGKALLLMNQKDEEMSKAVNKNMELEDLMRKLEMENQTWQRIAREKETMVQRLNSTLEQVRERAAAMEDEGSSWGGEGVVAKNKMSDCSNCGSNGVTRVLFLPCRHLCCCIDCEVGLVVCPICNTPKKNRIEAFF